ncbi:uncharacterized protein TrAtP1_000927 [Trichoderma atroviride]|uniref:uncharacterized protein n=1 Tax=Hypocrea atroviridis TaxID=63577 RepID=UPI00331D9533|nr:hypothetical protein TrAtP1_000927 [Trichoderma atroviride]
MASPTIWRAQHRQTDYTTRPSVPSDDDCLLDPERIGTGPWIETGQDVAANQTPSALERWAYRQLRRHCSTAKESSSTSPAQAADSYRSACCMLQIPQPSLGEQHAHSCRPQGFFCNKRSQSYPCDVTHDRRTRY